MIEPDADDRWWATWWAVLLGTLALAFWFGTDDRHGAALSGCGWTLFMRYAEQAYRGWQQHWREQRRIKERRERLARRTPSQVARDEKFSEAARKMSAALVGAQVPSDDDRFDGLNTIIESGKDDGK